MIMTVRLSRDALRDLLKRWQRQELSHREVHEWAEARYCVSSFEPEDDVANEVLAALDLLDINVTTEADIPYLLDALASTSADEASLIMASRPFDLEQRRLRYGDDPIYGPFLR